MAYGTTATDRLRRANVDIRHGDPILGDPSSLRLYFCECGADGCAAYVELAPGEFDTVIGGGTHVLAPGHVLQRAKAARRVAHALQGDARALQAEAQQAVRKSKQRQAALQPGRVWHDDRRPRLALGLSPRIRLGWRLRTTQPGAVIQVLWLRIYVG